MGQDLVAVVEHGGMEVALLLIQHTEEALWKIRNSY